MLFRLVTAHYIRLVEYASEFEGRNRASYRCIQSDIFSLSLSLFFHFFAPPLPSHNISPLHGGRVKWFEKLGWKLQLNLQAIAICDGTATFGQPWQTNGRKRNVIERVSGRVTISIRSSLLNSFLIINPEIPPLFLLPQSACCALLFELTKWTRKG